ncbi:sensor domain-containing diguanylate cyclase [Heyndrickxia shackletonii]|uniref:sensor domain-containing diguanylate cyclase n=1 Tax=Heyndrickxia shackletonii TaxID=157838 RepID=UPI0006EC0760|nr:sensor domain-containing diguanylate cyclase [Heyndrickxia shackletonii]MBB2480649.1 diguanylate cyclase [Bacillus sp. APMAM]NEY99954.1 diguanylate cyclase [Heyndrickxia shackletonii]RTZ56068.1 diguanylate cyclase [Bacillus sp. SAJ1]
MKLNNKLSIILLLWFLIVPIGVFYTFQFFPPKPVDVPVIIAFCVLAGIVSYFPIHINSSPIYIFQWVNMAGFISYGLFFELILTQFSIIVVLMSLKVKKEEAYRYPYNSIMFFGISLLSGILYFAIGGKIGFTSLQDNILPIIIYAIANVLINHFFLYISNPFVGKRISLFELDVLWELLIICIVVPLSIILYYLNEQFSYIAFLLIGLPFMGFGYVVRLYNSSERFNDYLHKAAEIGHQLNETLEVDEIFDLFIQKVSQTLTVDYAYILDVQGDEMVLLRGMENGLQMPNIIPPIKKYEGISGHVWATEKPVFYNNKGEWENIADGYMPENIESILCVPIFKNKKVEGVLFLASTKRGQYEKYQLPILDILCSYFVVAISNARHYEQTKMNSEHCPLTQLYNYRYFDNLLTNEFLLLNKGIRKELSLIMLDIDSFKMINDTFGHQSGNDILVMLAKRITGLIGNRGIVARYGGEEFVILLKDTSKAAALNLAELVRLTIANRPFLFENSLDENMGEVEVQITVSIGVATAPYDADEAIALIRHADRALYIGAKRAGKNRVAEYVK